MKRLLVLTFAALLLWQGAAAEKYITLYTHGPEDAARVAITVDDWWEPERLQEFLDAAKEYGAKLTLYPVGEILAEKDAALWQRAVAEGHEIGNHTNTHKDLSKATRDSILKQLGNFEKNLRAVLGEDYQVNTLRFPFGAGRHSGTKSAFAKAVSDAGYIHVALWDIDTTDPDKIMRKVHNGAIILLHGNKKDLKTLQNILPRLKEAGYEAVTISQLLGLTKTQPAPASANKQ